MGIQGRRIDDATREAIRQALLNGERVSAVCKKYHINRSTALNFKNAAPSTPAPGATPPPAAPPPTAPPSSAATPPGAGTSLPPGAADPEALARARAASAPPPPPPGAVPPGQGAVPPTGSVPPPSVDPLADEKFVLSTIGGMKEQAVESCIGVGYFPDLPKVRAAAKIGPVAENALRANAAPVAAALRKVMGFGWISVVIALGADAMFTYFAIRAAAIEEYQRRRGKGGAPPEEDEEPAQPPVGEQPPPQTPPGWKPQSKEKIVDAEFTPFDSTRPPKSIPDPRKTVG